MPNKLPAFKYTLLALAMGLSACDGDSNSSDPIAPNSAPTAIAGNEQSLNERSQVTLYGTGSDTDGRVVSYHWQQISGTSTTISNPNHSTTTFSTPEVTNDETLVFELTVTDDDGATGTDRVNINVVNVNQLPTANAGEDQIANENSQYTLTGSGNDPDGQIASYTWQQINGTQVSLETADSASVTFTTPSVITQEQLSFSLTITDNDGASATDTVNVTVINVNQIPVVEAGEDRQVDEQTYLTLNGSATDADGSIVSYQWQQTSGVDVYLYTTNEEQLSFQAPAVDSDSTITLELTAIDNEGAAGKDQVEITVKAVEGLISDVVFEDNSLRDCVRDLARENGWLKVDQIKSLVCSFTHLSSIKGIESFTALEELVLWDDDHLNSRSTLNDISPLANLTELTTLRLSFFREIEDISAVANLTKLTQLSLSNGKIIDISSLENLTRLTWLFLDENWQLNDISVLSNLTSLTFLSLAYTDASDISPLTELTELTSLNLTATSISEVTSLSKLTELESLGLGFNRLLTSLDGILNHTKFNELNLFGTDNLPCSQIETINTNFTGAYLSLPQSCVSD